MATEGFRIATAYVEIQSKYDSPAIVAAAGQRTGETYASGIDGRLRDSAGRFASTFSESVRKVDPEARSSGGKVGRSMLSGITDAFMAGVKPALTMGLSGLSGLGSALSSNPYVAAAGAAIGAGIAAVAAPAIGAGIAGALIGGSGLGVIVAGALLAFKKDPDLKKAGAELGKTIMGVDTEPLKEAYKAAQEKLTAAVKSGSKDRIAQAKAEAAEAKKALDEAYEFNQTNRSLPELAGGALAVPLEASVHALRRAFIELTPAIQQAFQAVAPAIKPLTDGFIGLVKNAMPGLLTLLQASAPFLTELSKSMPQLGAALSQFFEAVAAGGPGAALFFRDLLAFVGGQLIVWGHLIGLLAQAYVSVRDFFTSIPGWLSAAGAWFSSTWSTISSFFVGLWAEVSSWPGKVGSALASLGSKIVGFLSDVGSWFAALPGRLWGLLSSIPGHLQRAFVQAFDLATFAIGYGIGLVIGFFAALPGRVVSAIQAIPGLVSSLFTKAWNLAKNATTAGVSAVVSFFAGLPGKAQSALSSLWSRISGAFTSARSNASSTASSLVSGVVSTLSGLPGKAASAVSSFASRVASTLRGAVSSAKSIGADIIRGLIGGINSMIGAAVSAAKRAVGNIVSGAKSALGIGSPSKVFANEVGAWIPPGIEQGIEKRMPQLIRTVGDLLPQAAAPVAGMAPAVQSTGTTVHTLNVTIPVADLAELRTVTDFIDRIQSTARQYGARTPAMAR